MNKRGNFRMDKVIRLLYYLHMERMSEEEFINNIDGHITSLKNLDNKALKILVGKLEEENKNLKLENAKLKDRIITDENFEEKLDEENKKLKKENEELKEAMKELNNYNKFRIQENERLKSDLEECECSFWFESDEVWFWKWEYKRLKKWIKDHCKWYWNLFPEDEMKRQWKKADKKRK